MAVICKRTLSQGVLGTHLHIGFSASYSLGVPKMGIKYSMGIRYLFLSVQSFEVDICIGCREPYTNAGLEIFLL